LGLEKHSSLLNGWSRHWLKDMCIIRPSAAPYGEGLFLNVALDKKQSLRLRKLDIFQDLVPKAAFL